MPRTCIRMFIKVAEEKKHFNVHDIKAFLVFFPLLIQCPEPRETLDDMYKSGWACPNLPRWSRWIFRSACMVLWIITLLGFHVSKDLHSKKRPTSENHQLILWCLAAHLRKSSTYILKVSHLWKSSTHNTKIGGPISGNHQLTFLKVAHLWKLSTHSKKVRGPPLKIINL